uniref:(northern house mosquito) hypothetical protein n=1 Tax=Culex pipiens TaxID=7175 RepID=A0A8D8CHF6_CULPI
MSRRGRADGTSLRMQFRCPNGEHCVRRLEPGNEAVLLRTDAVQQRFGPDDEILREELHDRSGSFQVGPPKLRSAGGVQDLSRNQAALEPLHRGIVQVVRRRHFLRFAEATFD